MKTAKDHCKCRPFNFSINSFKWGQVVLNWMVFNTSWKRSIRPRRSVINFFLSRSTKWSRLRFAALLFRKTISIARRKKSGKREKKYACTMNTYTTQIRLWWLTHCYGDDVYMSFSFWMSERYHLSSYVDLSQGNQTAPSCKRNADKFISSLGRKMWREHSRNVDIDATRQRVNVYANAHDMLSTTSFHEK